MSQQPNSSTNSSGSIGWAPDDVYSQVFGKERPGRVRGVGLGPTPSRHGLSTSNDKEIVEERRKDKEKIRILEENLKNMKDKLAKFDNIEERIAKQMEERLLKQQEQFALLIQQSSNMGLQVT